MIIKSGVASAKAAVPGWRRRRVWLIAGCSVAVVLIAVLAARDTIEKTLLERSLGGAFGGDATIGNLYHTDSGTVLERVQIATAGNTASVSSNRISYQVSGDTWTVTPDDLHVTVTVDKLRGDELSNAQSSAHVLNMNRLILHLKNANVSLVRSAPAAKLEIAGVTGTADALGALHYDLHGSIASDTGAYSFNATDTAWTSAALPVAPIVAMLGIPDLAARGGEAHDIAFAFGGGEMHGTFTLSAVNGSIAGYSVHDLAGPVTVVNDGIGSAGLDAILADGTPVAAVGEVHDGVNWAHIFTSGTRDLRALARMFALIARQPNHRWMNVETTAPGVTFGQYAMTTKTTPHVVQLIEVDPHEPTLHFNTALADDKIISKGARTSDMALRTHAIAGANGDYFDIGRTYEPQGLLIESGRLLHGPTDHEAVVIDRNNKVTFARFHLRGSATDGGRRYPITLFNSWPTREAAIITTDYGAPLKAAPGVTFAALTPLGGDAYRVTALTPMTSEIPVTFGIGFGVEIRTPLPRVGDTLTLHYALDPPVPDAVAGIGSGPLLLKDGHWYEDKHAPAPDERDVQWPVIAIGTMPADTYMFAAVDGRHPERSIGMTRPEFAELLRGFGMIDAMALDSGGSVTLVSRAPGNAESTVRNVPSDFDAERYVSDALYVYSSAPLGTIVTKARPHVEPSPYPAVSDAPFPVPTP